MPVQVAVCSPVASGVDGFELLPGGLVLEVGNVLSVREGGVWLVSKVSSKTYQPWKSNTLYFLFFFSTVNVLVERHIFSWIHCQLFKLVTKIPRFL